MSNNEKVMFIYTISTLTHEIVIILFSSSKLVMRTKKACCHKLSSILLKSVRVGRIKTVKNDCGCFHHHRSRLLSLFYESISRFGAAPFLFSFVVLSSLAALFVLFPA